MESPRARAVVKYKHKSEVAVLKVTDDRKWVLFKCRSMDQIEQFVKLSSKLMLGVDPTEEKMQEEETRDAKGKKKGKGKGGKK